MAIVMRMEPQTPPMTFRSLCETRPPFSIAIDGYVAEGPCYDERGPWLNLNHHEGVSRIDTHATCGQAAMHVHLGLYDTFCDDGGPRAEVCMNDCDQDVCVTWTVLHNPHLLSNTMFPTLNRLIGVADIMDTTAGAYPFPKTMPFLRELAWIFEPYRQCRQGGQLAAKDPKTYARVVEDVEQRILSHISGRGGAVDLDMRYEIIGGGTGWVMVREIGADARTAMFGDGIKAFIAVRDLGNNRYTYSYGRLSPYVKFPLLRLYDALNQAEGIAANDPNRHGGSDTIGGSLRSRNGSGLPPKEVERITEECVQRHLHHR